MMNLMTLKQELHAGCLGSGRLYTVYWETFAQDYFRPCIYIYHFHAVLNSPEITFNTHFALSSKHQPKLGYFFVFMVRGQNGRKVN